MDPTTGTASVDVPDGRWGRMPGARPPLPAWAPAGFALVLGVLLTLVVVLVVRPPGPLDQDRLASQRDGLLLDGPQVPDQVAGVTFGSAPVVLLFLREPADTQVLTDWAAQVPDEASIVVVVQDPGRQNQEALAAQTVQVVNDPDEQLADTVGLPAPNIGGPGIGYAVVDSARVVRYATLDPSWRQNAFEVATIVGATP